MNRGRAARVSGRASLAAPVLLGLALSLLPSCQSRQKYQGWALDPVVTAPDLSLAGAGGSRLSLAHPDRPVTLVTFGYTNCPDVCPATLSGWRRIKTRLGGEAARVRFLFVSVDWRNDRPEAAAGFARRFDPGFEGAVADSAQLTRLLPAFRAAARYDTLPGSTQSVTHTDYSYLVDAAGRIRLSYEFASEPAKLEHDIRALLHERPAAAR